MAGKPKQQEKKKGGFKVGPKLGKGVYKGHAKKIKDTLIHKAKVKKAYHKTLAAEGYATGANGGGLGVRRPGKPEPAGSGSDDDEEDDAEMEGQIGEAEKEEQRRKLRREMDAAQGMEDEDEEQGSDSDEEEESGRGGARQPKLVKPPVREPLPEIAYPGPSSKSTRRHQEEVPAPAPKKRGPPEPTARPPRKPKLTEKEIEAIREKKAAERREWGKRGSKGQPKLGGRVEQLLGRIQRSMA